MKEELTYTTSTAKMPGIGECLQEILYYSRKLLEKKWWQDKSSTKRRLGFYLGILEDHYKL